MTVLGPQPAPLCRFKGVRGEIEIPPRFSLGGRGGILFSKENIPLASPYRTGTVPPGTPVIFSARRKENGLWTVQKKRRWAQTCTCVQVCLHTGASEYMPTKIGDLLPVRAGGWQLNQTSPRVWCGGRLLGACRIDFFLFSLSLPRRWMRAVLKRQRKEDDRASGTSNEVSARPNTRESDDCEGAVRCEPAFFLLTAHCAAVGCCAAYGCGPFSF